MKSDTKAREGIREYLLGQSTTDDAARVEECFLMEDDCYQELLVAEDELVDQYLAGELTASEKQSFENYFLATPERREKLRFARNLRKYVAAETASGADTTTKVISPAPVRRNLWALLLRRPVLTYSLAAVTIVVLAFVAIRVFRNLKPPPQATGNVLAIELTPGLSRGDGGITQVAVSADTSTVQVQLRVPTDPSYQTYRAILNTTDGRNIFQQNNLRRDPAANDQVLLPVPARLLTPGDYDLKLSGRNQQSDYEPLARYAFRVTNK